jgi:hypothetical protein
MSMNERIQKRLQKDRPMTSISLRIPEDVIEDLKAIAPTLGFSGYQPLIRAYIGQGLRKDLARLENDQVKLVVESLRRHGVNDQVIAEAIAEVKAKTAWNLGPLCLHEKWRLVTRLLVVPPSARSFQVVRNPEPRTAFL